MYMYTVLQWCSRGAVIKPMKQWIQKPIPEKLYLAIHMWCLAKELLHFCSRCAQWQGGPKSFRSWTTAAHSNRRRCSKLNVWPFLQRALDATSSNCSADISFSPGRRNLKDRRMGSVQPFNFQRWFEPEERLSQVPDKARASPRPIPAASSLQGCTSTGRQIRKTECAPTP